MDPDIVFTWKFVKYTVASSARTASCIVLPNGTALEVTVWSAGSPPGVVFAREINHSFKGEPVEYVATQLHGVVADYA